MKPTRVLIVGSKGRMGQMLIACAQQDPELQLAGQVDVGDDLSAAMANCDVVVEFALREATLATAQLAVKRGKTLVIGTTGHAEQEKQVIRDTVKPIACVWAANFSVGVSTLFCGVANVARIVGPTWDVEIVETHHTAKKDAPSGTAKRIQEILREVRGKDVPAHALRIGDVVGDHTVTFGTAGERIEITHRAGSRETFARGALRAAKWVVQRKPGLYDMQDVLGLK